MRKHGTGFFLKAIVLLGIAALGLSACGGGSDSVTPPSSPATLTADAGDNQVVLNWPSVSGAATYNVYYGTATPVTTSSTKITGIVSAPNTVAGLTNGTPYFFAVSAVNAGGESALSVERSATPDATPPPGAPTNIRASAGDNQVTVSWDNVTGATSYNVYYGTATGVTTASTKVTGATSPNAISGLLNGTTYFFVVTAVNGNGESAVSFEASALPTATPPPAAPSLTSATAGNAQVTLVWGAVTTATSYNVYHGTASGVTKVSGIKAAGVTSPYAVTGLTNGTPYFFIVTAQGAGGESAASNERSATPTAPAAAFSQADLTGTWKINMLRTSSDNTENGWLRATGTANASGSITVSSFEDSTGDTTLPPAGSLQWTIDGSGVVSESGVNGNDNVHMTMTSNKNFIAGTGGSFNHELRVIQKVVSGTSYSNADLASKSFVIHGLMVGADNTWSWQDGTTDASRMVNLANDWSPNGDNGPQANAGTISVDGTGTVTIDTMPGFKGFLSADKKTIVGTSTETDGPNTFYSLLLFQISGQTFAAADLVGTSSGHMLGVGNANFWARYTATGAAGGGIAFSSYLDSSGGTTAPSAVTASITSAGTVTLSDPSFQFHGTMSFDKKFTVVTQTNGPGIYSLSVMTQ
ncbi:MAG: fibronectin type III domain-containing protein [Candidatus Deferrimicrobium sp.]